MCLLMESKSGRAVTISQGASGRAVTISRYNQQSKAV